jgi:hypothetical protein
MNSFVFLIVLFAQICNMVSAQCSFQYISNDTVFQDYISTIYPGKKDNYIYTTGSRINRGVLNDSIFNAPVFTSFDSCGNIINKTIFRNIGLNKIKHSPIPKHTSYPMEPIGNSSIRIREDEFLFVDKAIDTVLNKTVLILFKIDNNGTLVEYNTYNLNSHEANQTTIKHVLKLQDGNILIILWDHNTEYNFYYFSENLDYLNKQVFNLGRGIRSINEISNGEFICTSLASGTSSFQFYKFDTSGSGKIKWIVTPYNYSGASARDVRIINNKIYITGATGLFGVFLICDIDGTILNEVRFDNFYCDQRFCSSNVYEENAIIISGYVKNCKSMDSSGYDISIIKIDTNGTLLWHKLYDFRSGLGTLDSDGYYNDFGGFFSAIANDGSVLTNGISRYKRLSPGGILHEDAVLLRTEPILITNLENKLNKENKQFKISPNPVQSKINMEGPLELIINWIIYSMQGEPLYKGHAWQEGINIQKLKPGMYILQLTDQKNRRTILKFIKV